MYGDKMGLGDEIVDNIGVILFIIGLFIVVAGYFYGLEYIMLTFFNST